MDISQAERDALFMNKGISKHTARITYLISPKDALQSYQRKPDCFQDAIALVKARCEESRMDEQERIHGTRIHHSRITVVLSNHAYKLRLA